MSRTSRTATQSGRENGTATEGGARTAVTVFGLGLMGRALAEQFLKDGRPTTVWNRSPSKADDLIARGAVRAATAAEAVAASPLVIMCVLDNDVVRAILEPVGEALDGRILVNLTSGTPDQARELAAWAAERGAGYLDGAIMAIPPMIGQAETILFYSGEPSIFEAHQSTLKLLGGATTHVGADAGLAALYDMALLTMMYTLYSGFLHGLALMGTARIDGATLVPYATRLLADVVSWLPDAAREVDAGDYATEISTLDINKAGVALIVNTSQRLGLSAEVLRPIQALIDRRVAEGHGGDGMASLIEAIRQPAEHTRGTT